VFPLNEIIQGNCLEVLRGWPAESVDLEMFSPPYWGLRCYGKETETVWGGEENCQHEWSDETKVWHEGTSAGEKQLTNRGSFHTDAVSKHGFCVKCGGWRGELGLEPHPLMYVEHLVLICRELKRVLKKTGSMYIVIGDTFAGSHCGKGDTREVGNFRKNEGLYEKDSPQASEFAESWIRPKQQLNMPFHVAFALQQDGWIQRDRAIWHKPNSMPGSQKDRLTCSYEFIFHFVKNDKTILWRNMETGDWCSLRPVQQYVKDVGGLRVTTTECPTVLKKLLSECSELEREERKKWRRLWMGFDYYYELDAIREPHKSLFAPFNLRVRDVKRGKGGLSAQGVLKASPMETEGYAYPESGRMRRLVQRLYEISQKIRGESYEGKNQELKGWNEACSNAKAYRDALKILEQEEKLSDLELKFLKDYVQNHLGHPLGRNPGDVLRYGSKYERHSYGQTLQAFIREQSVAKRRLESREEAKRLFPNDLEKQQEYINYVHDHDSHPLGPSPRDVIKHDLAVGRTRNVSYMDPLHEKAYSQQGKNPGDVYTQDGRSVGTNVGEKGKLVFRAVQWRPQTRLLRLDGKNPRDVFRDKTADEAFKGPLTSRQAPEPSEPNAFHALGKNPGDVTKIGTHHGSSLSGEGRATHYKGQIIEAHPLGVNPSDFWSVNTKPFKGAHFAVYPVEICIKPILSSCPPGGVVLDPMCGAGSTLVAAKLLRRKWVGIDINPQYCELAKKRLAESTDKKISKSQHKEIGKSASLDAYLRG